MDISINLERNEILYEIGDWVGMIPLDKLVHNFSGLSAKGKDLITTAVIGYMLQGISGVDDEQDVNTIQERFNQLIN